MILADFTQDAEYQGTPFLQWRAKPGLDLTTVDVEAQAAPFISGQGIAGLSIGTIVILINEES